MSHNPGNARKKASMRQRKKKRDMRKIRVERQKRKKPANVLETEEKKGKVP